MKQHPGDPSNTQRLKEMVRVNYAGECGALHIYEGQLAVLKDLPLRETIAHMHAQEKIHQKIFQKLMIDRKIRPTVLSPLWRVAGYSLGAMTALLGRKATLACTEAVEEVIIDHYQQQLNVLAQYNIQDADLQESIVKCQADEADHRTIAMEGLGEKREEETGQETGQGTGQETKAHRVLTGLIKTGTRVAIFLSKKL